MSLQKKYFYTFRDVRNLQYTVEIWQEITATISAIELRADLNPFTINYPQIANKLQPVRGSGCSLNMVSSTNMQLLGLYTAAFKEYQIRLITGGSLIWCGYMDSEIYSEPLGELTDYSVSISGTDGLALLDRMNYIQDDGSNFTGIISQFDILKFIIGKLGLPFNYVNICLQTEITGVSEGLGETILNLTYVHNSNFYDEDNVPMTLRQVLESILQPYGAYILQENGSLFITDISSFFYDDFFEFKQYSVALAYIGYYTGFDLMSIDLSGQRFAPDSKITIVPGINKQIINYSPYQTIDLIDSACDDFDTLIYTADYGDYPLNWREYRYANSATWETTYPNNVFCKMVAPDGSDSYLKLPTTSYADSNLVTYTGKVPELVGSSLDFNIYADAGIWREENEQYLINSVVTYLDVYYVCVLQHQSDPADPPTVNSLGAWVVTTAAILTPIPTESMYYLKMSAQAYVRTTDILGGDPLYNIYSARVKVFCGMADPASTPEYNMIWTFWDKDKFGVKSIISDRWIELNPIKIPLWGQTLRTLKLQIGGYAVLNGNDLEMSNATSKDMRLKNIKLSIVDYAGNEITESDTEYIGTLDPLYRNEGNSITLLQGTNVNDFPCEKAGLMQLSEGVYTWLKNWTRVVTTDNIENLLLRTIAGNYAGKTIELTLTTSLTIFMVGFIAYSSVFPGSVFMITGCTKNLTDCTSTIILQEVFNDSLTISKTW